MAVGRLHVPWTVSQSHYSNDLACIEGKSDPDEPPHLNFPP
jgi:hypothetical protein